MDDKNYFEDIIFARATPPGASAVALIRISGKSSWDLIDKLFIPKSDLLKITTHRIYFGQIKSNDEIIDNVLLLTFAQDKSYTGEESFEISCHGSEVIISMILKTLFSLGARQADPGEFTKRAFLNGKIDLTEAESIMDLIKSNTKRSALIAVRQLSGQLSRIILDINDMIADLIAEIEVYIDYPEEDIVDDSEKWLSDVNDIILRLNDLLKGFNRGRYLREGIHAVICGRTNTGKSTLFNFLINEDKAIVSDIHGTTRDYLDGLINIEGFGIRIYDTAGLRETSDPIENEGKNRSLKLIENADLVLYVISCIEGLSDDDIAYINKIDNEKKVMFIINKTDQCKSSDAVIDKLNKNINFNFCKYSIIRMSALKKTGLDDFNDNFLKFYNEGVNNETDDPAVTNERHAFLLNEALHNLNQSIVCLKDQTLDLFAFELREALNRLGEITGEITSDDIINRIFSDFCVGK